MIVKLLLLGIVSSVYSQSFHHTITSEDLEHVFSVKNAAEVPNYDIVPISIRKTRSLGMNKRFFFQQPFGRRLKMWLTPSDGTLFSKNLPVSFISYDRFSPDQLRETKSELNYDDTFFYENKFYATTLAVNYHANGKYSVKGFIGTKYIKPIPPHLMDYARRHRRSVHEALDPESNDEIYHVVYDIPQAQKEMLSQPVKLPLASLGTPRASNSIIYPEIFVIVEHNVVNKEDSLEDKVLYVLAFWNGVDMRYRNFANPKIRLNIARIVFAEDPHVLPHISKFADNHYIYEKDYALDTMGYWLYRMNHIFPTNSYDLAVTLTLKLLCDKPYNSNQICSTTGIAFKSGACTIDNKNETIYKVAFVRDAGRFNGIKTAAHELGHLLGVDNHDYIHENEPCDRSDGYLMTPSEDYANHSFEWSNCSIRQMGRFLRSEDARCLYDQPSYNENPLPRYLPGKLFTPNEQCQAFENASFNTTAEFNCHAMACSLGNRPDQNLIIEPAEGTSCGYGKLCLHGFCIDENSIE